MKQCMHANNMQLTNQNSWKLGSFHRMETRPYSFTWPNATKIYGIFPERMFKKASQKIDNQKNFVHYIGRLFCKLILLLIEQI